MPKLTEHSAQHSIKLLLLGDSGSGKTSALLPLIEAGYKLFILDFDNGLDPLVNLIRTKPNTKELMERVTFETLTDKYKAVGGIMVLDGQPKAFATAMNLLTKWPDVGSVQELGPDTILVIDSLTFLAKAAFRWVESINFSKDGRAIYGEAQKRVEACLAALYSPETRCHIIAISHIVYLEQELEGVTKGYPSSIGRALSPTIPRYFNTTLQTFIKPGGARVIKTKPTGIVDLKTAVPPDQLPAELPLSSGLRDFFRLATGKDKP